MLLSFLAQADAAPAGWGVLCASLDPPAYRASDARPRNRIGRALRSVYADTLTAPLTPRQVELSGMLQSRETDALRLTKAAQAMKQAEQVSRLHWAAAAGSAMVRTFMRRVASH